MNTASQLYDLVSCPQRVSLDTFGDPTDRDQISPFVRMLWDRGTMWEHEVVEGLQIPFLDLSPYGLEEREHQTTVAMARSEPLIYGPRIQHGDLLGDPDLLRFERGVYVPIDIKSGNGEFSSDVEDGSDAKPKKTYAVQLGLYLDILEQKRHCRRAAWLHMGRQGARSALLI